MKSNSTFVCSVLFAVAIFSLNFNVAQGQCVAPDMAYANPVLVSGTAGQINAMYKFPSVTPGVDAYIKVLDIVGGASLTSIDDNTFGYSAAWQPVVKTPTEQGVSESYVSFNVDYRNSIDSSLHAFECFSLSFIDVDGDNQHVREFVAAKGYDSYSVSGITDLILLESGGFLKATGPILNFAGIDTSSFQTNISYKYINKDEIPEVRVGNITDNVFTVQNRYSCAYFRPIIMPAISILPLKYISFDATTMDSKSVKLNWVVNLEQNSSKFEIERSFNNNNFKLIGTLPDGALKSVNNKIYNFNDDAAELQGKTVVYYRIKQVNTDGKISYSKTLAVRLVTNSGVEMQVSPNPFVENLNVRFNSSENGEAEIRITNTAGQKILSKHSVVNKGYSNIQVDGLGKLPNGLYMAQLIVNGIIIDNQKVIRN